MRSIIRRTTRECTRSVIGTQRTIAGNELRGYCIVQTSKDVKRTAIDRSETVLWPGVGGMAGSSPSRQLGSEFDAPSWAILTVSRAFDGGVRGI